MSSEDAKILKLNQYQKSDKAPLAIYIYLECLIEKNDGCKINSGSSSTIKVSECIPSFRNTENKHNVYRGKDCMKEFCESLREHTVKII